MTFSSLDASFPPLRVSVNCSKMKMPSVFSFNAVFMKIAYWNDLKSCYVLSGKNAQEAGSHFETKHPDLRQLYKPLHFGDICN